jgi:sugar lactone lactonase YvrE
MKRRVFLYVSIAVGVTALSPALITLAAEQPTPGTITTVAGTGPRGFSGDNGPATKARLNWPQGIAIDAAGNVFIGDSANNRVRKVSPDGIITTVAGTGVEGLSGDGGPATEARLGGGLLFLALDGAGNLYLSDTGHHRVRKVSPDGIITTVAGSGPTTDDAPGDYAGDGGPATKARLYYPVGLAVDAAGNLFIADTGNHRIRKVSPDGTITTVAGSGPTGPDKGVAAGDGGPATAATLRGPMCLAVDGSGNLFFSEFDPWGTRAPLTPRGLVRKVSPDGIITTVAGNGVYAFSGDGGPAVAASLDGPLGVAADTAGNLFIADFDSYRVRKVDAHGIINTVAGMGKYRYAGDGVLATTTGLRGPIAVAIDASGNLVFTDTGRWPAHDIDGLGDGERVLKVFGVAAPGLLAGMPFPKPQ